MSTTLIDRGGFVRIWDGQAQAPYLWNKETRTFISYDDPESLRLKGAYIREKGLARRDVLGVLRRQDRRVARHAVHELARLEPATRQCGRRQAFALIAL